jgi:hypothetical protein
MAEAESAAAPAGGEALPVEPFGDTAPPIVSAMPPDSPPSPPDAEEEPPAPGESGAPPPPPAAALPSGQCDDEPRPSPVRAASAPIAPLALSTPQRKPAGERPPAEEIAAAMDLLAHGVPPDDFDPTTLRCCIDELIAQKRAAIDGKDYIKADRLAQLIRQSQKAADVSDFAMQCTQKLAYFQGKHADAQAKVDETNETWDGLFGEFEEMVDGKMQELIDAQNRELEEFDGERPSDLPAKYKKHSVEYNALRKREHLLTLTEDFIVAHVVKARADAMEADEVTGQHVKLQDDLQRQRNAIVEKHSQQFNAFATWLNGKRAEMVRARALDLAGPMRRLAHYAALVEQIERKGLPPNPYYGFTANRVSRKESLKALRMAAQTPMERDLTKIKPREMAAMSGFRPTMAIRLANSPPIKKPRPGH